MRVLAPIYVRESAIMDPDEKELFPEKFDIKRLGMPATYGSRS